MDIGAWLEGLGLGKYAQAFSDNDIDAATLPRLTSEDLKEIGVESVGHRRKLLDAIAALAGGQEAAPLSDVQAEPVPAGELRQITVLFADLAGFTKLSGELGAEQTHVLLNRYFAAVDGIVKGYGGTIDKHIGDNVMAIFGAPVAHGDDPERAVRAALDIHEAMNNLSAEAGHTLQVHIGIASGQVVASGTGSEAHREYTVTGESVNLASRLQDKANTGETLMSHAVYGAVSGLADCTPMGEIEVKGFQEPVQVWRLDGFLTDTSVAERTSFVGRKAELRQFAGALDSCRETGTGQTVFVRGEAGIGKTRLVEEFTAIAEGPGFASHKSLVLDFGVGKGQDAIRALVRSLFGIASGADKAVRAAAVERTLAEGLLEPDRQVYLNDLLDLPQPTEMRAMYEAMDNATRNRGKRGTVGALIKGTSARQPVLVTVEDIHWADALTLAHLATISSTVKDCPAVLVMTSRIEGDPIDQTWRSTTRGSPLMTIDLAPLRNDEAIAFVGELIDATTPFAMRCVERAEGNPLFLEQLLHSAETTMEDSLPGSVQSIVLARIDNLDAPDKRALQAASVIGQRFSLDVLCHLIESPQFTCTGLIEHFLVRPEGEDYLFAHALVREGVYSSLLRARRCELHRKAAEWFAERDSMLKAEHLDRADDPAAPRTYLEAAEAQASEFRYERARQLVERGLELATDQAAKYDLTCFRGDILRDLGSIADSIDAFRNALEFSDDDVKKCRAWIGMAAGMRIVDRYDEAFEALDLAESAAINHGLTGDLAQIHSHRGNLYFPLGDIDGCVEQHTLARKYAREASSPESEARALSGLGDANYMRGRMITAHDNFHRCVELCRQHGLGRIEVANLAMRGVTQMYQNHLTAALHDCRAAIEAAAKVGHQRAELIARSGVMGFMLIDMSDFAGAREENELGLQLARRLGAKRFEPASLFNLARIVATQGDRTKAVKLAEEAVSISRETGITFRGPTALGVLAIVTDDPKRRRSALVEGERLLREGCVGHNHLWFYRDAMEACLDSGHWDDVERFAAALEDYTRVEPLPWTDFFIARGRALAVYGRGRRDAGTITELQRLRDEADRVGLKLAMAALEAALTSAP